MGAGGRVDSLRRVAEHGDRRLWLFLPVADHHARLRQRPEHVRASNETIAGIKPLIDEADECAVRRREASTT
jgi:hypothetical protein